MSDDNVLEILRVADKEDVVSNLLTYCVEQHGTFRSLFLRQVCGFDPNSYSSCEVRARPQVQGAGVPDLVVICRGQTTDWAIIENKLKAEEGKDQTERYAEQKTVDVLREKFDLDPSAGQPKFVFLTLFPDQRPCSKKFSRACYSSLLESQPLDGEDGTLAHQLASAWLDLLERFYASEKLHPDDPVADKLSNEHVLDESYLAFSALIRGLSLPPELERDDLFRQSERGRKYYGAAFRKPKWVSEPFDDKENQWTLPEGNRRIHIEPQYHVLSQTLKVYIHYETNPYYPVEKLKRRISPEQYEAYRIRREAFALHFADLDPAPFQVRVHSNQLTSIEISLADNTVAQAQHEIQELLRVAAKAIDSSLEVEQAS